MKLKDIAILVITEMLFLAALLVFILFPVYVYQTGGGWNIGLLVLLVGWKLLCLGIIFKK